MAIWPPAAPLIAPLLYLSLMHLLTHAVDFLFISCSAGSLWILLGAIRIAPVLIASAVCILGGALARHPVLSQALAHKQGGAALFTVA